MVVKLKDLKKGEYVTILNSIAQDMTLSVYARSMLLYMASMPTNFIFTVKQLSLQNHFNPKRTKSTIKELVDKGYMRSSKVKDNKGRFIRFDYIVTQRSNQFSQFVEDLECCSEELPF